MRTNRLWSIITKERVEEYRYENVKNTKSCRKMNLSFLSRLLNWTKKTNKIHHFADISDIQMSPDPSIHIRRVKSYDDICNVSEDKLKHYQTHLATCYRQLSFYNHLLQNI